MTEPGATPTAITQAEAELGVSLPEDYRQWLRQVNGSESWHGTMFVALYSLDLVLAVTSAAEAQVRLPGFVAIGSNGSREILAFDVRSATPHIILVDVSAESWAEGIEQADSFTELLAKRDRDELFVWN